MGSGTSRIRTRDELGRQIGSVVSNIDHERNREERTKKIFRRIKITVFFVAAASLLLYAAIYFGVIWRKGNSGLYLAQTAIPLVLIPLFAWGIFYCMKRCAVWSLERHRRRLHNLDEARRNLLQEVVSDPAYQETRDILARYGQGVHV